jgi:acyl carrier protein phosphodiesterase
MNYLAHLILSGTNKDVMFGNFIGDGIKGNKYLLFQEEIKKGILLHRHIDNFTDNHYLCLKSKKRFYECAPKLAGVVCDILYDFLLWENWNKYYKQNTKEFIADTYLELDNRIEFMPLKIAMLYSHMRTHDWLNSYTKFSGIESAVFGISRRVGLTVNMDLFREIYYDNEVVYNAEFNTFYKELKLSSEKFLL